MSDHDAIRTLLAPVALGAATDQERADVERHAASCHDCRAELDGLRAAASQLALDVPQLDPPPALKGRIMDAVRAEPRRTSAPAVVPTRRRRFAAWPAAAGVLGALVVGLVAWNLTLRSDSDVTRTIAIAPTTQTPTVAGTVQLREDGSAVMRVTGLPELPTDQGYELWTIRDGTARSEGFAARTASGELVVATADLSGVETLAITPERRTNTTAPTVTPVVAVPL